MLVTLLMLLASTLKPFSQASNSDGIIVLIIYSGLFIEDAAPIHDVQNNMLEPSTDDSQAEIITYYTN